MRVGINMVNQVHKFGGSSLSSADRFKSVANIILTHAQAGDCVVVSAAGKTLTSSSIKPLKLNTGERKTLSVPLSLSLSEAGSSVLRLLTGKAAVTYTLNGEMGIAPDLKAWKPKPLTFKSEKSLSL